MSELAEFSNGWVNIGIRDRLKMIFIETARAPSMMHTKPDIGQVGIALVQIFESERRTGKVAQQTFEPNPVGGLDAHRAIHREAASSSSWARAA